MEQHVPSAESMLERPPVSLAEAATTLGIGLNTLKKYRELLQIPDIKGILGGKQIFISAEDVALIQYVKAHPYLTVQIQAQPALLDQIRKRVRREAPSATDEQAGSDTSSAAKS